MSIVPAPRINTNDDQVGVVAWHVEDGDYVEIGADLVDLETSKAVVTIAAEIAGYIRIVVKKGAIVRVGASICEISAIPGAAPLDDAVASIFPADASVSARSASEKRDVATPVRTEGGFATTRFSREALRLIDEHGLDPAIFTDAGLVTGRMIREKRDPTSARKRGKSRAVASRPAATLAPLPIAPRDEPTSLAKRAEIDVLTLGETGLINSTLSVYFDSAAIRARLAQDGLFDGNIQPIILYEISRLLRQWPQFTAFFDDNIVHYYERVDLGVAIDMGRGLKVVTIKDADLLMPTDLHEHMIDVGLRYLENQIRLDELVGSTITVTDLSGLDVLHFKPLINGRQSAIIGLGGDSEQPGHPMSLNMSFDHRVSNGREAGTFLKELRTRLLSYAPPREEYSVPLPSARSGALTRAVEVMREPPPPFCSQCGIARKEYFESLSNPFWFACFADDGALEAFCHRCAGGLT